MDDLAQAGIISVSRSKMYKRIYGLETVYCNDERTIGDLLRPPVEHIVKKELLSFDELEFVIYSRPEK